MVARHRQVVYCHLRLDEIRSVLLGHRGSALENLDLACELTKCQVMHVRLLHAASRVS